MIIHNKAGFVQNGNRLFLYDEYYIVLLAAQYHSKTADRTDMPCGLARVCEVEQRHVPLCS